MTEAELITKILEKRPQLASHLSVNQSVGERAKQMLVGAPLSQRGSQIRVAFQKIARDKIHNLYGESLAHRFDTDFSRLRAFSTADHHGALSFPLLINSNLLHHIGCTAASMGFQLVLPCSTVPLSNVSFPRGWFFKNRKLPLVPSKWSEHTTYLMPKSDFSSFEGAVARTELVREEKAFLFEFHKEMHNPLLFENCRDYSDQLSILSHKIWPRYFAESTNIAPLFALTAEDILAKLFIESVIPDQSLPLYQAIFNTKTRTLLLDAMKNLPGALGPQGGGTQLFWGARSDGRALSLRVEGNFLIGTDFKLELEPTAISEALVNKKIYSSQVVFYGLLAFHAGYQLLGGFNQIEVLHKMKEGWKTIGRHLSDADFCVSLESLQTNGLICGPELLPTQGLDTVMAGGMTSSHINDISQTPFRQVLSANLRTILEIVK